MCVLKAKLYCDAHTSSLVSSSVLSFTFVNCTDFFFRINFFLDDFLSGLFLSSFLSSSSSVIGSGHSSLMCPFWPQLWQVLLSSSILLYAVQIYWYLVSKMLLLMLRVVSLLGSTACIHLAIGKPIPYCEVSYHYPLYNRFPTPQLSVHIAWGRNWQRMHMKDKSLVL